MRMWLILLIILGALLGSWLSWTFYSSGNLETPQYSVAETYDGFEVREYKPYIAASVTVPGTYRDALYSGFGILANYIFGDNQSQTKVSMTAPVTESVSESIAMTAPVTEQQVGENRIVTFMMPSQYTLETLPIPNDDRISFVKEPAQRYAALTFSWYASEERVNRKTTQLQELLDINNIKPVGPPIVAQYNDPWSFPLLRKNEILIAVE